MSCVENIKRSARLSCRSWESTIRLAGEIQSRHLLVDLRFGIYSISEFLSSKLICRHMLENLVVRYHRIIGEGVLGKRWTLQKVVKATPDTLKYCRGLLVHV